MKIKQKKKNNHRVPKSEQRQGVSRFTPTRKQNTNYNKNSYWGKRKKTQMREKMEESEKERVKRGEIMNTLLKKRGTVKDEGERGDG